MSIRTRRGASIATRSMTIPPLLPRYRERLFFRLPSGIIVMAARSLCGMRETQLLNGLKNLLGAVAAGASIAALAVGGQVARAAAALMMSGLLAGRLLGARVAQRIDAHALPEHMIVPKSRCSRRNQNSGNWRDQTP